MKTEERRLAVEAHLAEEWHAGESEICAFSVALELNWKLEQVQAVGRRYHRRTTSQILDGSVTCQYANGRWTLSPTGRSIEHGAPTRA
jgi:hypothetical protein